MTDSILRRLKNESTPLIDQDMVTFVWRGRSSPFIVGDFTGWDTGNAIKFEKQDRGLWTCTLNFPPDAYIEYGLVKGEKSLNDPFNPRLISNGVGGFNNFFSLPDYTPTDLVKNDKRIPHGTIRKFDLPTDYMLTRNKRTIYLYQPPTKSQVPLLVVWDGQEYLKRSRLNFIVDNLIAQRRIRSIAMAFVNNGGQASRTLEYACNDATLTFLMSQVLPLASKELSLVDIKASPGEYGVLGASMSGLMALYTGARLPHVFGKVLSQSGAFSMGNLDMVVFDLLEQGDRRSLRIWMDVGTYDLAGLLKVNQRMQGILIQRGYPLTYREFHAGHNYTAWRDDIWRGLEAMYGLE